MFCCAWRHSHLPFIDGAGVQSVLIWTTSVMLHPSRVVETSKNQQCVVAVVVVVNVVMVVTVSSNVQQSDTENDTARQAVFFTPLNPFREDPDEEKPHDDHTILQKVHHHSYWKRKQDAVNWIKLPRQQDQGSCARRLHL